MSNFTSPKQQKKILNRRRHDFLLTFFDLPHKYDFKEVNGYVLVRQFNSNIQQWEVAIYTKEIWEESKKMKQEIKLNQTGFL